MFAKKVIAYIFAHILLLGGANNTRVYVAPEEKASAPIVSTTAPIAITNNIKPTTTPKVIKNIGTTTKSAKTENKSVIPQVDTPKAPVEVDFESINQFARKATVNILCSAKGGELSPISGTGVIVEPNGLILTNAHIGQYLLLKDFKQKDFIDCIARTGSPAYPKYNLELVYISPTWVGENKTLLKQENPKGTGENDFAFLRITKMIDDTNLPKEFPFVTMNIRENIGVNEPVVLVSYPAGFLRGLSILQNLNITSAITRIQDVFTFKDGTIDIIAVGGTVVSQKGSSGGLVVDENSTLIGVISTSSDGNTTESRGLNAITLSHISRVIKKELGINMVQFLNQDYSDFAKIFASTTAPTLTKLITDELNKQ